MPRRFQAGIPSCAPKLWTGLGTGFAQFVKSAGFVRTGAGLTAMAEKTTQPRPTAEPIPKVETIPFAPLRRGQAAGRVGRLIRMIPAATRTTEPRIAPFRVSPNKSAPSDRDRTGVRKLKDATVDDG